MFMILRSLTIERIIEIENLDFEDNDKFLN